MEIHRLKNRNGKWFFHIVGANGEIIAASPKYSSKTKATQTALKLLRDGFVAFKDENGKVIEQAYYAKTAK